MAATDDPHTLGRTRLSFADEKDVDEFVETLDRFERGEIGPDAWRAFRLVRGTYSQRQGGDAQMLRVKIPQGILDVAQLQAVANVAERHSRGFCHLTTRQNIQLHFVKLHDVEPAMRLLAEHGLTTREACGNSVRNITACPYAGVAADEAFDVTPFAEAMTRHLLRHPLSSTLPRKFKIGFEGCPQDHALTSINDLGFHARVRGENGGRQKGFRVTVGGGTAILCRSGNELFEFLPAGDILAVAEAVVRVYHKLGDFKHRQRNRLKFLIRDIGYEAWRRAFDESLEELRREGVPSLPFRPELPPSEEAPGGRRVAPPTAVAAAEQVMAAVVKGPGIFPDVRPRLVLDDASFQEWALTHVRRQRQAGYSMATVTLALGDVTAGQLRVLAHVAASLGDGTVRTTHEQDLLLRWVDTRDLRRLYTVLAAAGLTDAPTGVANVVSCPGAEACRLAVTQSRAVAKLVADALDEQPQLAATPGFTVKVSGCPNGCGHHHVGSIGLQGSVRRLGSRVVPQYFVMAGGEAAVGGASFGRLVAKVPARRAGAAVQRLLALYAAERRAGETPGAFLQRVDLGRLKDLLADLEALTPEDARPEDYVDLGEEEQFEVTTMEGECAT